MSRRGAFRFASLMAAVLVAIMLLPMGTLAGGSTAEKDISALSPRILCNRLTEETAGAKVPEIWTMNYSGGDKTRIRRHGDAPCGAQGACYAPNGAWMAFQALDQDPSFKSMAIWLSSYDGLNPQQVTPFMDLSGEGFWPNGQPKATHQFQMPTFSHDSSQLYFTSMRKELDEDGNIVNKVYVSDLCKVNVDGSGFEIIRPGLVSGSEDLCQASPAHDGICFHQSMPSPSYQWTTDAYGSTVGISPDFGFFTMNSNGGGVIQLAALCVYQNMGGLYGYVVDQIMPIGRAAWSPNGKKLAIPYMVQWSDRTAWGLQSYYYYAISVVEAGKTTNLSVNDIWSGSYSFGTRITPTDFPTPGDPTLQDGVMVVNVAWSADGDYVLFDALKVIDLVAGTAEMDVYAIDVSNLAAPGNPINLSKDKITSYPNASPDDLGDNPVDPPLEKRPFYLAEGTTRPNFDEWLAIQNPNEQDVNVELDYQLAGGAGSGGASESQQVVVPKKSRYTVKVVDTVGQGKDVSVVATSDQPVIVERPIYFNYGADKGLGWTGGHDVVGATAARETWYFAEGTTRNNAIDGAYEEWLCLQNPNDDDAEVTITYMLGSGDNKEQKITVNGKSRYTVDVRLEVGDNQNVSAKVTSSQPIIAERPMYFSYGMEKGLNWTGGHDVLGY